MTQAVEAEGQFPPSRAESALLTFLIADVRGYTHFTVEQGDEAAARLAGRFAAIATEMTVARGGEVIELRGDEALAVFASARQALHAALDLQARFSHEVEIDPSLPLRVGIGLDAGEAIPVEGGYRGGALNLAARLCSIAGPGDIFCSDTVIGLARKTDGIAFVERGAVTLKGLSSPVRVIQIVPEGELPTDLPPLQPLLVTQLTNLPDDPTPFIGREEEIKRITRLLRDPSIRLVTLTGPGGTGKTRLALQAGNTLLYDFPDGVFFVSLASLADPALVPPAIAEVLGVKEDGSHDLLSSLTEHLIQKRLLLVLDNFEHLLDACGVVSSLLEACRELHVLITSRIPLRLRREHEHAVPVLAVPDVRNLPDLATLSQYDSVALFIERARAAKDGFALTNDNAPAVAEICSRLDGLPLAIELGAARIKLFPPLALLDRLSSRLTLLTGGPRDLPGRQRTLRGAIDWSYSLLSDDDKELFARLSVFVGGCTFEAAEAVCNSQGSLDLLEGLASLVDKSLLRQEGEEEPRFVMLETLREFASEQLAEHGEQDVVQQLHAAYVSALVEEAESGLIGSEQAVWLRRLEREYENVRTALTWSVAERHELGMRLAPALWRFWYMRGHFTEGRRWLDAVLTIGHEHAGNPALLAKALNGAGNLAWIQGDHTRAKTLHEESLQLRRAVGDREGIAGSLNNLGLLATEQGKYDRAKVLHEESLRFSRELDDTKTIAASLNNLGNVAERQGNNDEASELYEESIRLARDLGDMLGVAHSLINLGVVAERQGDHQRAKALLDESLRLEHPLEDLWGIGRTLVGLAAVAGSQQNYDRAVHLLGASDAIWSDIGTPPDVWDREIVETVLQAASVAFGVEAYRAAWEEGQAMTVEQAVAYALDESE